MELLVRYSKIQKPMAKRLLEGSGKPRRSRQLVHASRHRLNATERRQLAVDYEAGRSTTWLMRTYHLGKGTVLKILAEQGVKMRGQGIPDERLDEAIALYKSGWSLIRVGEHVDCSSETVRQALIRAGLKLRKRWERATHSSATT